MDKYTILETLGDGTYGSVVKAINKTTNEEVAIKKMKKPLERVEKLQRNAPAGGAQAN